MGYVESAAPPGTSPERLAEAREIDRRLEALAAAFKPQLDMLDQLAHQMHSMADEIDSVQRRLEAPAEEAEAREER